LTSDQLSATLADVFGMVVQVPVSDELLTGYRANATSAVDETTARTVQATAEEVASTFANPVAGLPGCTDDDCADYLLDIGATRLFRRPVPEAERQPWRDLFRDGAIHGGRTEGVRWVLEAMLQHPRFLYHVEDVGTDGRLDGYSMAARLSYTFWAGPPDDALLAAAAANQLQSPAGLNAAVDYLIADPKFERGMRHFVQQWLRLGELREESERPDIVALPSDVRLALENEPVSWVVAQVRTEGAVYDLLTATTGPAFPALDRLYGADRQATSNGQATFDPARRSGVLTLPGVQAAASHALDTSPTRRGDLILSQWLCAPPGPPPDNAATTLPPPQEGQTKRERLEAHFHDPSCSSCHSQMDGLGFGFEPYDWLGRSRTDDGGQPLDPEVSIWFRGDTLAADDGLGLTHVLAERQDVSECVARHFTRYAAGILEDPTATCVVQDMGRAPSLREMMRTLVLSEWFRRPAPEAP
jgi:hypothetical protein